MFEPLDPAQTRAKGPASAPGPGHRYDWPELARALRQLLPAKAVVTARQELLAYDSDGLTLERHQPPLVVLPETTEQVAAVLRLCHERSIPFVARGSGTGLSGGAVAEVEALVIATSRMRQVLSVDLANQRITVQPGVINSWVTRSVVGDGFYYAPDPSSQQVCTIGGNVAENSGGVHCLKYGVTSNHVLAMEVVLPDGTVTTLGRHLRLGATQGGHRAIGQHHLHFQHMVAGDAVLEAMDAAGVFGNVAADRADLLAGGIGGVIEAVAHHRAGHPAVDHPGLHGDALVGQIHREHLAHAAGGNHQGLPFSHGAAGKPGATAPGHKGNRALVAEPQHRRHLLGGFRQDHQGRLVALQGEAIAVVGEQFLAGCHHGLGRQQLAQGPGQLRPVVALAGAGARRRAFG